MRKSDENRNAGKATLEEILYIPRPSDVVGHILDWWGRRRGTHDSGDAHIFGRKGQAGT